MFHQHLSTPGWIMSFEQLGPACILCMLKLLVPFVQRLDNAIQWISVNKTNHAIRWIVIYPVDSVIHPWNNPGLNHCSCRPSYDLDGGSG